jgi:hypothetical protein
VTLDGLFKKAEESTTDSVYTRASETHPVDVFVGIDHQLLAIQVRSFDRPPIPPRIAAISIEVNPPRAGKWSTVIKLRRPDLRYLFVKLAEDLLRETDKGEATAGRVVMTRLAQWQRLLAAGPLGILTESERRGLAAELAFLRDEVVPKLGIRPGIAAWKGPFQAPRDFEVTECDIEVKALRDGTRTLAINSLEQLELATKPIYLWVQTVELGTPLDIGLPEHSLASLVQDLRTAINSDSEAAEQFEHALRAAGYEERPEYSREPLTIGRHWCLRVREDFPRIERRATAAGVLSCTYDISWPEVSRYECGTWVTDR